MPTPPDFTNGTPLDASSLAAIGLWKVADAAFTGATTFDVTGFSSTYTEYRLVIRTRRVDVAGSGTFTGQIRSSGTPITTGYFQGSARFTYLGVIASEYLRNNQSNFVFGASDSFGVPSIFSYDISATSGVGFTFTGGGYFTGQAYQLSSGGAVASGTAFDRIRMSFDFGTHSGTWELFGYKA
jgi:hypothetical protein